MIVVSDTAPIIFFGKVNKLSLLKDLYDTIYVPTEVWEELIYPITHSQQKIPDDIKLELEAKNAGWLIVKNPEKEESIELALNISKNLGLGEAYAIALSKELKADLLLINDRKAREIAIELGINTKWTTEILLDAVSKKFIASFKDFEQILNTMIENGLWIEKNFYSQLLEEVKLKFGT